MADRKNSGKTGVAGGALVAAFVIGAAAGALGASFAQPRTAPLSTSAADKAAAYQEGYLAAQQKLQELGLLAPEPATLHALPGVIMSVDAEKKTFVLRVDKTAINPLDKDLPMDRTVTVGEKTSVVALMPRDRNAYEKDLKAYNEAVAKKDAAAPGKDLPVAPSAFEPKALKFEDLKQGDQVIVSAEEDIKSAASFTASKVEVGAAAAMMELPPPENRPAAPDDNRPAPPKEGETPTLPPPPTTTAPTR